MTLCLEMHSMVGEQDDESNFKADAQRRADALKQRVDMSERVLNETHLHRQKMCHRVVNTLLTSLSEVSKYVKSCDSIRKEIERHLSEEDSSNSIDFLMSMLDDHLAPQTGEGQ